MKINIEKLQNFNDNYLKSLLINNLLKTLKLKIDYYSLVIFD